MDDKIPKAAQNFSEMSTAELAKRIKSGEISTREVVEAHIRRIEAVNPHLNAVVIPLFEEALSQAATADEIRTRGEPLGPLLSISEKGVTKWTR